MLPESALSFMHAFPLQSVVLGALCGWLLLRILMPYLRNRLLDQPNSRSSHSHATPRGGGLAFVLAAAAASGFYLIQTIYLRHSGMPLGVLLLMGLPLAFVGFLDDRHNLPVSWRYVVQLVTSLGLILLSPLPLPLLALPLFLAASTAIINFTNFMDGMDGLVAGCMAITVAAACLQQSAPWPFWALVGALIGFLFLNWCPAKVFMGDVGSTYLGAVFAGLVLQAGSWLEALGLLLVATPMLADACLCVPRRLIAGQPVFQAHCLHLFQRLHQAGWSHSRVSLLYITATAACAVTLLLAGWREVLFLAALELMVGFWLDQCVAVPFATSGTGTYSHPPEMPD